MLPSPCPLKKISVLLTTINAGLTLEEKLERTKKQPPEAFASLTLASAQLHGSEV